MTSPCADVDVCVETAVPHSIVVTDHHPLDELITNDRKRVPEPRQDTSEVSTIRSRNERKRTILDDRRQHIVRGQTTRAATPDVSTRFANKLLLYAIIDARAVSLLQVHASVPIRLSLTTS